MVIIIFCSAGLHSPLVILWRNSCETVESCNLTFAGVTKKKR